MSRNGSFIVLAAVYFVATPPFATAAPVGATSFPPSVSAQVLVKSTVKRSNGSMRFKTSREVYRDGRKSLGKGTFANKKYGHRKFSNNY